jgi:hypothetical protein
MMLIARDSLLVTRARTWGSTGISNAFCGQSAFVTHFDFLSDYRP